MRNISNVSLNNLSIDIILATYNGEKYVEQLLDSIVETGTDKFDLIVSDDGSTDRTLELIGTYKAKFNSILVLQGPKQGSTRNFLNALEHSNADISIFADQDDIWIPGKISEVVKNIGNLQQPLAHFGRARILNSRKVMPKHRGFPIAMYRNTVQLNCTSINSQFRTILTQLNYSPIHLDWFIYLLAKLLGSATISEDFTLNYRLHTENQIGVPRLKTKLSSYFHDLHEFGSRSELAEQIRFLSNLDFQNIELDAANHFSNASKALSGSLINRLKYSFHLIRFSFTISDYAIALQILRGSYSSK